MTGFPTRSANTKINCPQTQSDAPRPKPNNSRYGQNPIEQSGQSDRPRTTTTKQQWQMTEEALPVNPQPVTYRGRTRDHAGTVVVWGHTNPLAQRSDYRATQHLANVNHCSSSSETMRHHFSKRTQVNQMTRSYQA